jgi:hypothetical protein
MVLPLLVEDRVEAGEHSLWVCRCVRVAARGGEVCFGHGREEVADHRLPCCAGLEDHRVRGRRVGEHRRVIGLGVSVVMRQSRWVIRVFEFKDGAAEPRVSGHDEVPQGLGDRPLVVDGGVDRARRHGVKAGQRRGPGLLDRGPRGSQPVRVGRVAQLPAGELSVERRIHDRHNVNSVDEQAITGFHEPGRVDLHPAHVAPPHDDAAEIAPNEPRTA